MLPHFKKSMTQEYTIASAPGKVLVTGGYLVLEQQYPGLVIGTTSRFYTVIASADDNLITVQSPQFDNAEWKYEARLDENNKLQFSTM